MLCPSITTFSSIHLAIAGAGGYNQETLAFQLFRRHIHLLWYQFSDVRFIDVPCELLAYTSKSLIMKMLRHALQRRIQNPVKHLRWSILRK